MVVSRYDLFKDTLTSDWSKNPKVKGVTDTLKGAVTPPSTVGRNIYGNGGAQSAATPSPAVAQQPAQSFSVGSTARSMLNKTDISPAVNPVSRTQQLGAPQEQFHSRLKSGIEYTGDDQGNRTFTMGTPGQDGYGKMTVHAGTARRQLGTPQQSQSPYSFTGSAADAAKFNAPAASTMMRRTLGTPQAQDQGMSSLDMSHQAWLEHSGQGAKSGPQMPKYLTKEEGSALGLGWKGRMIKYREDLDAFNKATGNQAALDIESMREGGAGSRALLHAQGVNDLNAIARQRLSGDQARGALDLEIKELELGRGKQLDSLTNRLVEEKDPSEQKKLQRQLLALQGRVTDQRQSNVQMIKESIPGDPMGGTMERPIQINDDGTFTRMRESGSNSTTDYAAMLGGMAEKDQRNFLSALKKSNPKEYDRLKTYFSQKNK